MFRIIVAALASAPASAKKLAGQARCDAAQIMTAEVSEALKICGPFDAASKNPTLLALLNLAFDCDMLSPAGELNGDRGKANFDYFVKTLGARKACDNFISAIPK